MYFEQHKTNIGIVAVLRPGMSGDVASHTVSSQTSCAPPQAGPTSTVQQMSGHVIPHPGCTTAKGQPLRRTCGDAAWPSPPVAVIDVNLFLRFYNFPLQTNQAKVS
jgi:hypothetical protein